MSSDDIEAINTYIQGTTPRTPEATTLKAQWATFYNNLNFITKSLDSTFEDAENRRNIFNAANLAPADLQNAADLTAAQKIKRQAAIAASPALSPMQKAAAIAKNPNIPTTSGVPGSAIKRATIKQGSKGVDVIAWQQIIGVAADGNFGSGTVTATKAWQSKHGLTADGTVGPKTWSAAIGTPVQESATNNFSAGPTPFVGAAPKSPPFSPVSPSVSAHVAAVNAGTTPPPNAAVKAASALVASNPMHTVLKVGIPAIGLLAGGWLFGIPGALIGGAAGFFGSTKV